MEGRDEEESEGDGGKYRGNGGREEQGEGEREGMCVRDGKEREKVNATTTPWAQMHTCNIPNQLCQIQSLLLY